MSGQDLHKEERPRCNGAEPNRKAISVNTDLSVFRHEGVDIRVVMVDGDPWWVATDVTRALGIVNGRNATGRLDADGVRQADITDSLGRQQSVTVVNEPGLYELIIRSDKPEAREFRRWVTHEVLPAIRRTGSYAVEHAQRALPQSFAEALRDLASEFEAHEATKAELEAATPRAEAWDAIASAEGDYSVGDAAKILARAGIATGPQRLFQQLEAIKWIYRGSDGKPRAYADRMEKGYLYQRPQFHYHPGTGERVLDAPQVRITVKGLERLRQRLHQGALKAVSA